MTRTNLSLISLLLGLWLGMGFPSLLYGQGVTPDITVALDGSGDFTSIQAAIDAVPSNSSTQTIIYIKRGLYNTEKLIIPANKTNVVMIGESRDETIISYHMYDCQTGGFNGKCPAADAQQWSSDLLSSSATLTIEGDNFQAENLTIENTAGPVGQAQAITVRSDRVVFRNCNLTGYQDTIYLWTNGKRSYFENCLVVGRTDYIYGGGVAFFQSCEIRSWGGGWITAPSTEQNQPYGFVFNQCDLTYALNSPRTGDDGALVRLGRPWQNYPKVAWLYCEMTEKIHPEGWGDTWNMPYAPTSPDLHLYEYMNTGPGADTTGRANWVGLRTLTAAEAANYTVQAVLNGSDGWDPSAVPPAVPTYDWTGAGATADWLLADNWNPVAVPDTNEAAFVSGPDTIEATGGHFVADLTLSDYATLQVNTTSEITYLAVNGGIIQSNVASSLTGGRIRTKDSLIVQVANDFDLNTELIGVHVVDKSGAGSLNLMADNYNFQGFWTISEGNLGAEVPRSLGRARNVAVANGASLTVEVADAMDTQTALYLNSGGQLILNDDLTLLEFYLDSSLQAVGTYDASTNPGLISGSGTLTVGRPTSFIFEGTVNGNWDGAENYRPALLPEAGDTAYTSIEMETTAFDFMADIFVQAGGRIRLRGVHSASGTIHLETGALFAYATSGTGFTLNAPTEVLGEVTFEMNSRAEPEHAMRLGGPISGSGKITAYNRRENTENTGTVILLGDNRGFDGIWDLTLPSGNVNGVTAMQGLGEYAFGRGLIEVGVNNRVRLSHPDCAGDTLRVNLYDDARIVLDDDIAVQHALIDGTALADGTYDASTNPEYFEGDGKLLINVNTSVLSPAEEGKIYYAQRKLFLLGQRNQVSVFDLNGRQVMAERSGGVVSLPKLPAGLYLVRYRIDGRQGSLKIAVQP